MLKQIFSIAVAGIALAASGISLAASGMAGAAAVTTTVSGTFNNSQENACIHVSTFFYLADCSYERSHPQIDGQALAWVGPTVNPVYYAPGSPHAVPAYRPVPGDDRIVPTLVGTLTVDDRGTADGADDLISATLDVGPAARNVVSNINSMAGRPPRAVETWSGIRHVLAATRVSAATRNAAGGFDYVIGSKGFPQLLCRKADPADCFTSAYAPKTTDGPKGVGVWAGPAQAGIGRDPYLGGNLGATTDATMTGYSCADDADGRECAAANVVWGSSKAAPGFSNLVLKVSTDHGGHVLKAAGYWTHEYRINAGPDSFQLPAGQNNSWQGGFLQLTGAPVAGASSDVTPARLHTAVNTSAQPHVFEWNLVAEETRLDLTGHGLMARAWTFNGGTPGPALRLTVGDRVVVHFTNRLPEPVSVHWHGVEVSNASDGNTLTQDLVPTGGSFTYRFIVPRPGIFWYHSHGAPTNFEFRGLYGPIIVTDGAQAQLLARHVLPDAEHTATLVLGDTTVCKGPGHNDTATFPADPALPWAFTRIGLGSFPGNTAFPAPQDLCDSPRDDHGNPLGTGALAAETIPNVQPPMNCGVEISCRTNEGQLVLVNGQVPPPRAGSPEAPGRLAAEAKPMAVAAGEGLRLQFVNAAVSRYFRLRLTDGDGRQVQLYRVGGEGGLLDRARLEGGMQGELDTKYERGEVLLAPSERADVVAVIPPQRSGAVLTLWTLDYRHMGTNEYPYGYAGLPTVPVAHFRVSGTARERFAMSEGTPLRQDAAVHAPVENIRAQPVTAHLRDPATLPVPQPGSASETILLTVLGLRESMDGVHGTALHASPGDYRAIPHLRSSRYAAIGDLLELTIQNGTQQHHPFHLHGFSFQPVRVTDLKGRTVREYDYNEFLDSVDIPDSHSLVVRVRLDDRPQLDGHTPGGAAGRWMMHCHIFNHAEIGMMSELVVLPQRP